MRKTTLQTRLNMFFSHEKKENSISQQAFPACRQAGQNYVQISITRHL